MMTQELSAELSENLPSRPNIVFLYADDLGFGDLGCYGNTEARTPVLDQLAADGTRFTQFYVSSGFCSPTRASAITGQHPSRLRIYAALGPLHRNEARGMPDWLDPQAPSVAETLKRSGYRTGIFGKWHLGGGSASEFRGHPINSADAPPVNDYGFHQSRTFFGNGKTWRGIERVDTPHEIYPYEDDEFLANSAELVTDAAIEFVQDWAARHREEPFLLYVWYHEPHVPLFPTDEMREPVRHLPEPAQTHYASIWYMDQQIGRLLDTLEHVDATKDTLVIFSSDNGAHLLNGGSNGILRGTKGSTWEGGSRVPFIARWPGTVPAGAVDEKSVVSILDLAPTFSALAGTTMSDGDAIDGVDISAALRGEPLSRQTPLFWHSLPHAWHPDWAVRSGDWKLLEDSFGGRILLFNLMEDPGETTNVADAHPTIVAELGTLLEEWRSKLPTNWKKLGPPRGVPPKDPQLSYPLGTQNDFSPDHES